EQLLACIDDLRERHPDLATVLVTHHLEELPATTSHALLLRDGRMLAAGPADDVLTSDLVSACFGYPVMIARHDGRWTCTARPGGQREPAAAGWTARAGMRDLERGAAAVAPAAAAAA